MRTKEQAQTWKNRNKPVKQDGSMRGPAPDDSGGRV